MGYLIFGGRDSAFGAIGGATNGGGFRGASGGDLLCTFITIAGVEIVAATLISDFLFL